MFRANIIQKLLLAFHEPHWITLRTRLRRGRYTLSCVLLTWTIARPSTTIEYDPLAIILSLILAKKPYRSWMLHKALLILHLERKTLNLQYLCWQDLSRSLGIRKCFFQNSWLAPHLVVFLGSMIPNIFTRFSDYYGYFRIINPSKSLSAVSALLDLAIGISPMTSSSVPTESGTEHGLLSDQLRQGFRGLLQQY